MTQTTSFCPNYKSRNLEVIDHEAADHPLIEIDRKQLIRYRCKECGKTFYNRREDFDIVKYTTDIEEYWEEKKIMK